MIETKRLIFRPLSLQDEEAFIHGIADDELRRMYGFPAEMSEDKAHRIFAHFLSLPTAYGLVRKTDDVLLGFVLDVAPELPEDVLRSLPEGGRTLAYATFSPYQRQGYMLEALSTLIENHFRSESRRYRRIMALSSLTNISATVKRTRSTSCSLSYTSPMS